jgi:hypothetical protein
MVVKGEVDGHERTESVPNHLPKLNIFHALSLTTTIAFLLVVAGYRAWSQTGRFCQLVTADRASVQIVIQVLANALGLVHVTAICRLINYATRMHFHETSISLDTLRAWVALSMARVDWDLPRRWLLPLVVLVAFNLVPSALWAGCITPLLTTTVIQKSLLIPSHANVSQIKGYPAEPNASLQVPSSGTLMDSSFTMLGYK